MSVKKSRVAIKISIVGVTISALFLISSFVTDYPLEVPIGLVIGNGLILLGNYIRYRKILSEDEVSG